MSFSVDLSFSTTTSTTQAPTIYTLYEADGCPNVGTPAGVTAEGSRLYWTNQVGGFSAGAIAEGQTFPKIKKIKFGKDDDSDGQPTFPSYKLQNNTGAAYGVCLTSSKIIYTESAHTVYAMSRGTQQVVALTTNLLKPRGVAWDGDNTVYVADQEANFIVAIPVGVLEANAPTTQSVDIHGPFGLALVKPKDPVWRPLMPWYEEQAIKNDES